MNKEIKNRIWRDIWEILGVVYLSTFVLTLVYDVDLKFKILIFIIAMFCYGMKEWYECKII